VTLVGTDVSKERISIARVEESASLSLLILSTQKMEVISSSESSVLISSTLRHIPEDGILHSHRRETLKSYTKLLLLVSCCVGDDEPLGHIMSGGISS
jgi:hypothetical protein